MALFNGGKTVICLGAFALTALALEACSKGPPELTPTEACMQTADPAKSIDACKQALVSAPNDAALRRQMAFLRLKSGALSSARQAYQIVLSQNAADADAEFGLGLTLEAIGEAGGNLKKVDAVRIDPAVIERYRKLGVSELDLMTFDTAPKIISGPGFGSIRPLIPDVPLAANLVVDLKCKVGATGQIHDCAILSPLPPAQANFGEAAKKIVAMTEVKPAQDKGKVVPDAPVILSMVFQARS